MMKQRGRRKTWLTKEAKNGTLPVFISMKKQMIGALKMGANTLQILIAMIMYRAVVIGIGLVYAKRANQNSEE